MGEVDDAVRVATVSTTVYHDEAVPRWLRSFRSSPILKSKRFER